MRYNAKKIEIKKKNWKWRKKSWKRRKKSWKGRKKKSWKIMMMMMIIEEKEEVVNNTVNRTCHFLSLGLQSHLQPRHLRSPRAGFPEEEDDAEGRREDDEVTDKTNAEGLRRHADGPESEAAAAWFVGYLKHETKH